jgi:hypothetical protein
MIADILAAIALTLAVVIPAWAQIALDLLQPGGGYRVVLPPGI